MTGDHLTVRGPAAGRHGRARAAVRRHRPAPRPCVEQWGLGYDLAGLERVRDDLRRGVRRAASPWSSRSRRSSRCSGRGGVAVLERVLAAPARRGHAGRCSTPSAATSARRWRPTPRPTSARTPPLPADAITVSPYLGFGSLRPALDLRPRRAAGSSCWRLTSNPEGPHGAARGCATAQRRRVRRGGRARPTNAGAAARGSSAASGWSSAPPSATPSQRPRARPGRRATDRCSRPGSGAQGARRRTCARSSATPCRRCCRPVSREVLAAGPDVAALREAAAERRSAVRAALWRLTASSAARPDGARHRRETVGCRRGRAR